MNSAKSLSFADLASSSEFREFFAISRDFTGLRVALIDPSGTEVIKLYPEQLENPLCLTIQSTLKGCKACQDTDRQHCQNAAYGHDGRYYNCHAGLVDIAVPLFIEGRHIATMNCGQIFLQPPTEKGYAQFLQQNAYLSPSATLHEAYFQTPYITKSKLDNIMRLFTFFAEYFCEVGCRLKDASQTHECQQIDRVQRYLRHHFREEITLPVVARHVNYSPAYLSMIFHRITGVTFSNYLQQLRIDEAKKLLCTTTLGITAIAGAAGFNNLTHFHRVFKKCEGTSPSQYRSNPPT